MQKTSFLNNNANNNQPQHQSFDSVQQQMPKSASRHSIKTPTNTMPETDANKKQNSSKTPSSPSASQMDSQAKNNNLSFASQNQNGLRHSPSSLLNMQSQSHSQSSQQNFAGMNPTKIFADELKELIQKEKQTTADLFMQLLKVQEDQLNISATNTNSTSNATLASSVASANQTSGNVASGNTVAPHFMHQNSNSNSNDNLFNELNANSTSILLNNNHFMQQSTSSSGIGASGQQMKSTTPVFVDQLLMSPLFTSFLPSSACSSASSASNSSTGSNSSTLTTSNTTLTNAQAAAAQFNSMQTSASFSQFAAAAMSAAINLNKTPSSSPTMAIESGQSSFKKTKNKPNSISKSKWSFEAKLCYLTIRKIKKVHI